MNKYLVRLFPAVCVGVCTASCLALPPVFSQHSSQSVLVNLNAGQRSFECTGVVIDLDPGDIVGLTTIGLPPFMQFEYQNGNPATFRIHAENLTGAQYGGYFVDVLAFDQRLEGNGLRFAISIIPEPSALAGTVPLLVLSRRRIASNSLR